MQARRWMVVTVVVCGALMTACAVVSQTSTCSQANCSGCCQPNGLCASGSTATTCGNAGRACVACSNGLQCIMGACTANGGGGFGGGGFGGGGFGGGGFGGGPFGGGSVAGGGGGFIGLGGGSFNEPFVTTTWSPAPISGGSLTLLDANTALVMDPDRERVWKVNLTTGTAGYAQFPAGSRPRRAVRTTDGVVHVLLRGTGLIADLDVTKLQADGYAGTFATQSTCLEPRDLAVEPVSGALLTTCQNGTLQRRDVAGVVTNTVLAADLRDVVVDSRGVYFTTFNKAQLVAADGTRQEAPSDSSATAEVAWRTVSTPLGIMMLHQRASSRSIAVQTAPPGSSPYGGMGSGGFFDGGIFPNVGGGLATGGGAPNGGGGGPAGGGPGAGGGAPDLDAGFPFPGLCNFGVVSTALTLFRPGRAPLSFSLPDALAVDLAVHVEGDIIQLAVAGAGGSGLSVYQLSAQELDITAPCLFPFGKASGQFTGVQFFSDGTLIAHDRENGVLLTFASAGVIRQVQYAKDGVDTAGSRLFHLAPRFGAAHSGTQLSCASCHPEATEDGHTWIIDDQPRRTQNLTGGVSGRAPFHWVGDLGSLGEVMGDTFVRRMGGQPPPPPFISSLSEWLDKQPATKTPALAPQDLAAGLAAFEKAGCHGCHAGPQRAGSIADVGTGGRFKTPTLIGVHSRTPLMHSGCAPNLRARFANDTCGGTQHGNASTLSATEFNALLTYLESL